MDSYSEAQQAAEAGDFVRASELSRALTEAEPQNPRAWGYRSQASLNLGRYDDAAYEIKQAIQLDPNTALLYALAGEILRKQEKYGQASKYFQQAVQLEPGNADYKLDYAVALAMNGDLNGAIPVLKDARRIAPNDQRIAAIYAEALMDHLVESWTTFPDDSKDITSEGMLQRSEAVLAELDSMGSSVTSSDDYKEIARVVKKAGRVQVDRWGEIGRAVFGIVLFIVIGSVVKNWATGAGVIIMVVGVGLSLFWLWLHIQVGWKLGARRYKRALRSA